MCGAQTVALAGRSRRRPNARHRKGAAHVRETATNTLDVTVYTKDRRKQRHLFPLHDKIDAETSDLLR